MEETGDIGSDNPAPVELALASLAHVRRLIAQQLSRSQSEIECEVLPLLAAAQDITAGGGLQACPDRLVSQVLLEVTALESIARSILLLISAHERALAVTGMTLAPDGCAAPPGQSRDAG